MLLVFYRMSFYSSSRLGLSAQYNAIPIPGRSSVDRAIALLSPLHCRLSRSSGMKEAADRVNMAKSTVDALAIAVSLNNSTNPSKRSLGLLTKASTNPDWTYALQNAAKISQLKSLFSVTFFIMNPKSFFVTGLVSGFLVNA